MSVALEMRPPAPSTGRPLRARTAGDGGRAGRPKTLPTRGCSCSTSRWPPSWASTPTGCGARRGVRFLVGNWCPTAPRRSRRPTPGTSSAASPAARRRPGAAARRARRRRRPPRDMHLKGSGRDAVRPRRRRAGRRRADAARVRRSARRCTRSASRPPGRWPSSRPASRCSGRPPLPGAVLARVAGSHLRVGTFQYAAATGDLDLLRRLADHAIARHYPARGGRRRTRTWRCSRRWSTRRPRWSRGGCSSGSSTA